MKHIASIVALFVFSAAVCCSPPSRNGPGRSATHMCGLKAKHSLGPDGKPMSARDWLVTVSSKAAAMC